MNPRIKIGVIAATALVAAAGFASAASASVATLTMQDLNPTVALNYSAQSCIGTVAPAWPSTIAPSSSATVQATSTLTSNGCSITYKKADNNKNCRFVATRIRSSLTGPWNYPTVNVYPSSTTGITCSYTIDSVNTNGDWSVTLKIN